VFWQHGKARPMRRAILMHPAPCYTSSNSRTRLRHATARMSGTKAAINKVDTWMSPSRSSNYLFHPHSGNRSFGEQREHSTISESRDQVTFFKASFPRGELLLIIRSLARRRFDISTANSAIHKGLDSVLWDGRTST
jgi:hypothetical protein